ncbi:MAG: hypothetical protein U0903_07250 [Planctomycetales bacterium]
MLQLRRSMIGTVLLSALISIGMAWFGKIHLHATPPASEKAVAEAPASSDDGVVKKSAPAKAPAKPKSSSASKESLGSALLRAFTSSTAVPEEEVILPKGVLRKVKVTGTKHGHALQTFCVDSKGQLVALVSSGPYDPTPKSGAEIQILSPEGQVLKKWDVSFTANSLTATPDGHIFAAGDGKVAKFDAEGKQLALVELSPISDLLKNTDQMRKDAEALIKRQQESYDSSIKMMEDRLKKLQDKNEDDLTSSDKSQIQNYKMMLGQQKMMKRHFADQKVEDVLNSQLKRLKRINAISVSPKDVFLVCGDSKGYGYAVWRTDHQFQNPTRIMNGLSGCCGQMDVQTAGEDILVAENTQHKFGRYTRDGKLVGKWGKRSRTSTPECFGGCCNPMNIRSGSNGDIFTAESEGIIKRFSAKGDFLGVVGQCSLSGGCKNVAVAVSPDSKTVYFCDTPGSQIIVLENKGDSVASTTK